MADASSERGWVNIDRAASFRLASKLALSPSERLLLYDLLLLVDFRQYEWVGSLSDLSTWSRLGWRTAKSVLERLANLGVVDVVDPFEHNGKGRIRVLLYEELVVPNRARRTSPALPSSLPSVPSTAKPLVRDSDSSKRAQRGPNGSTTGAEQGTDALRAALGVCSEPDCGAPADGQPSPDGTPWCKPHENF